jgi:chromatin remodeling complex protein RSC6
VHSTNAPVARCLSNYLSAVVIHIEGKTTASAAAAAAAAASSSSSAAVPSTPSAAAASAAASFALPSAAPLLTPSASGTAVTAAAAAAASSTTKEKEVSYSETIEWRKHTSVSLADGFEIRRHGSQGFIGDVHVLVQLYMDFSPPRFRVSPALARLLGLPLAAAPPLPSLYAPAAGAGATNVNPAPFIAFETSATVLTAFWDYVKSRGLYDALAVAPGSSSTSGSGGVVRCDAAMQSLFGVETMSGAHVLSYLQLHMSPAGAEPICIPYRLSTSTVSQQSPMHAPTLEPTPSPSRVVSYDILTHSPLVPGASSLSEAYSDASAYSGVKCASGAPPSIHAAAAALTDKLAGFMMELDRSHRRRVLLSSFSSAPLQSLQLLVASHARDLLVLPSITGVDDELERRAEYFHAEWIYDAVDRYQQEEQASNQRDMQTAANVFAEEE